MISRRMLRIKVIKALYAHLKSDADSLMASEKTLVASIDKTYDLYFLMLSLIAELAHYAEQRQEAAKQKKLPTYEDLNPNRKFVDNAAIRLIANSDSVNDFIAARKLSWANNPELIKTLFFKSGNHNRIRLEEKVFFCFGFIAFVENGNNGFA